MGRVVPIVWVALVICPASTAPGAEGEPVDKAPLKVSIAIPEHRGARAIVLDGPNSHFHVVLRNVSPRPVTIWRQWCSYGYDNLSFEYLGSDRKAAAVQKKPQAFLQNIPDPLTLAPDEEQVIDVYFGSDEWKGFPLPAPGGIGRVSLRAVFHIEAGAVARQHEVWTGRITSPFREYTFETRRK